MPGSVVADEPGTYDGKPIGPASDKSKGVASSDGGGGIEPMDRQDALRRLVAIGDFFRRTEPHTPISFLVQRAVRWGNMPFGSWLQEVIHDQAVLAHVRETLGIQEGDVLPESPPPVSDTDTQEPSEASTEQPYR